MRSPPRRLRRSTRRSTPPRSRRPGCATWAGSPSSPRSCAAPNPPPGHPARLVQASFYVDPSTLPRGVVNERGLPPGPQDVVWRTHTSPMQVRAMERSDPPLFIIVPGTVYRRDTIDATHLPMLNQDEGLAVGEGV